MSTFKEEVTEHICPHPACCTVPAPRPPKYAKLKAVVDVSQGDEKPAEQPTFHLFSFLPPELQLLVWEHAVQNCFVFYRWVVTNSRPSSARWRKLYREGKIKKKTTSKEVRSLCNKRWVRLLLACQPSHSVAQKADFEKRANYEDKQAYWHRGGLYENRSRHLLSEESKEYREWLDERGYEAESQKERDAADVRFYGRNA